MNKKTYKSYEREIGPLAENMAKDSCAKAKISYSITIIFTLY